MSLQQAIARTYGRTPAAAAAAAIVAVSLCTLGADVQAEAEAEPLTGVPFQYFVAPLVAVAFWMLDEVVRENRASSRVAHARLPLLRRERDLRAPRLGAGAAQHRRAALRDDAGLRDRSARAARH